MQPLQGLALFTAIEVNRNQSSMVSTSNFFMKTDNGRKKELKRLASSSINYDIKEGSLTGIKEERGGEGFTCSMKPKMLSWYVRGLNEKDKRMRIRGLIRNWKADIVCLQETKLKYVNRSVVRSLCGCKHLDWCFRVERGF